VVEPARPAFYGPPAGIPATAGTIIRSEPASYLLDPLGLSTGIATATKVMYASKDRLGRPIAVTGIVIVPKARWLGWSPCPLIRMPRARRAWPTGVLPGARWPRARITRSSGSVGW
jgi:hypothetical protein